VAEKRCCECRANPRAKNQRHCKDCHKEYMRVWRKKKREQLLKMKELINTAGNLHKEINV